MDIDKCTKADFDQIILEIEDFWGSDRTLHLHHPMFIYEFGNTAFVIREGDKVIAYLFGLMSQTAPTGYVHLIGVRRSHQRKGIGTRLYEHFIAIAKTQECIEIKAITSPINIPSALFHKSIGMELLGTPVENDISVVRDYNGPGRDAIVFQKKI